MAERSVHITLHNRTTEDLTLTSAKDLAHGVWTDGLEPPDNVGGAADAQWGSESSGLATGTEAFVVFALGGQGANVRIAWDNPFYGTNKYAIDVPAGYALYQDGWSGDNAEVTFTLESSTFHATNFRPSTNGFPYSNSWPDAPITTINLGVAQIPVGNASLGLCGGMVYAAVDYWAAGLPTPPERPPTEIGNPLYDYIVQRLIDSFDLPALPVRLFEIMNPAYPDTGSAGNPLEGRSPIMIKDAWPQIRSWIDQGWPAAICLQNTVSLNPVDLGENHQTVAWAYQMNGNRVTVYTYDPNIPGDDGVTVEFSAASVLDPPATALSRPGAQHEVYCFLTTAYAPSAPPQ